MIMEFRAFIQVPGLPYENEPAHEGLFDVLRRDFGRLGPVMSWTSRGDATVVVLATDAEDESEAAAEMIAAVSMSLHRSNLGNLYPAAIEIEVVDEELTPA